MSSFGAYARKKIQSAALRGHGGQERGVPPGAQVEARETAVETPPAVSREPEQQGGQAMAARLVRRVEAHGLGMKIVDQHRVISRECTDFDVKRIARESFLMRDFFGDHTVALAHPQVDDREPLRFFVLRHFLLEEAKATIIVNPRITRHSGYTVDSVEGCHTFPERPHKTVQRWRKCEVEYQVLDGDKLSEVREEQLVGFNAFVFQHELDHLDGKYCYD